MYNVFGDWIMTLRLYCSFILLLFHASSFVGSIRSDLHLTVGTSQADIIADDIFFVITSPEEISYTFKLRPSDFSPTFNESYHGIRLVPIDPPCGCGFPHNADEIEGSIALIERGECSFVSKTVKAQEAGATAVIITDQDKENDQLYIQMIDDATSRDIKIPAAFLLGKSGFVIRKTLEKLNRRYATINIPINVTTIPVHKLRQPPWLVW